MTYSETIEYLYNAAPAFEKVGASAYKEGLSNTLALDEHLGHPHRNYRTIHVAGTNGKGSCSHTLAAILQSAGYRVGLYTSPHLVDFRERIRVNGIRIPEKRVVRFVEEERSFFEPLRPSFFELTTALAFKHFEEAEVDVAVIEVGLGGRLDCTNIITPLLSVITNVSFDHTQLLGSSLTQIAGEKAGVMKQGVPCLVGEWTDETRTVFERVARERRTELHLAAEIHFEADFGLKGSYQTRNRNTVLNAVELLRDKLEISDKAVRDGLTNVCGLTGLMGRWQQLRDAPLVICDTGHNLAGWQYLVPQILDTLRNRKRHYADSSLHIVFGMADDKDINAVMNLLPTTARYYYCQASTRRAIKANVLAAMGTQRGLEGKAYPTVEEAYNAALADASEADFLFVGGSSYVVADLLTAMHRPRK